MACPDSKVLLGIRSPVTEITVYLKENKYLLMFICNAETEVLKIRRAKSVTTYVYLSC